MGAWVLAKLCAACCTPHFRMPLLPHAPLLQAKHVEEMALMYLDCGRQGLTNFRGKAAAVYRQRYRRQNEAAGIVDP